MKQIRRSIFETNSSSSHSITIATNNELLDTMVGNSDGMIVLTGGEFGWEVETYSDALTKANYCLTYAMGNRWDGGTKVNLHLLEMLRDVIESQTHYKVSFEPLNVPTSIFPLGGEGGRHSEAEGFGYIDHQSSDVAAEAFVNSIALRQFIFNKSSSLHTDNDNH